MLIHRSIPLSCVLCSLTAVGCDPPPSTGTATSALSLSGSTFEIDLDANLKVDNVQPSLDWANVTESRRNDLATGQQDNSFAGGSKEDDACPRLETGSIPNNKSDLLTFGAYAEAGVGSHPGFLHLFWTRVQEPSGTTLMDFELNQSATACTNGVNPVRTAGDLLLEYRLVQGGAAATIKVREWSGTAWGPEQDLTAANAAAGTINSSAIAAADSDGLITSGSVSPRTFGEASIDLSFIFDEDKCTSFGSAFVKSRASDSFTSALKDFIAPTPISLTNCGKVIIRKQTNPDGEAGSFGFTHDLQTDPAQTTSTFSLQDDGSQTFTQVLFSATGTSYTVEEDSLPTGFELASIDCSASVGVTPVTDLVARTVTFVIDDEDDIVDCTFTNRAKGSIVIEKVTTDSTGAFNFTSTTLGNFSLTTTGLGQAGKASTTFSERNPGTYDVAETVPTGWNLTSATCSDGSLPSAIALAAGETVTCTFVNARERGAIKIVKTRKHAASGPGDHPHAGVTFTVTGGDLIAPVVVVTNAQGVACIDGRGLSSFVGNYTVTESVPTGYRADGTVAKTVAVTQEASCPNGDQVNFGNTPLTTVTVSVDSLVDGGTASTINCTGLAQVTTNAVGDGSGTLSNLVPGTYTCTFVIDP